jgi:hypothetical protein
MTQADSVHSTPPTNTSALPVDPTRRRFINIAAGASVVSVGTLAVAAAIPTAGESINLGANETNVLAPKTSSKEITPSQGIEADPIYEVIERHRKACAAHNEAINIHMAFEESGMEGEKLEKYKRLVAETDAAYDRLDDVGCDLINTRPTTLAGILALCRYISPLFEEEDSPDLPTYILYDDGTTATPAEALCYVIGQAVEEMMKAQAGKAVQS